MHTHARTLTCWRHRHTFIHTYIHAYITTDLHTYVHTYINTHTQTHTNTHPHTHPHIHTHKPTHAHAHTHAHGHACADPNGFDKREQRPLDRPRCALQVLGYAKRKRILNREDVLEVFGYLYTTYGAHARARVCV